MLANRIEVGSLMYQVINFSLWLILSNNQIQLPEKKNQIVYDRKL